jgi:hypothetical protein
LEILRNDKVVVQDLVYQASNRNFARWLNYACGQAIDLSSEDLTVEGRLRLLQENNDKIASLGA